MASARLLVAFGEGTSVAGGRGRACRDLGAEEGAGEGFREESKGAATMTMGWSGMPPWPTSRLEDFGIG